MTSSVRSVSLCTLHVYIVVVVHDPKCPIDNVAPPSGYYFIAGTYHFYRYVDTPADFDAAIADCADDDPTNGRTKLMSVRSVEEFNALTKMGGKLEEVFHCSHHMYT